MNFDFTAALARLGANAAYTIANTARPAADYIFAQFLPEVNKPNYEAKSGNMTIRSTMAGLVGMDSPYPPTGIVESSTFNEQIAKVANWVPLSEAALRQLQELMRVLNPTGSTLTDAMVNEVLNFTNKVLLQPHLDTAEYLRGAALVEGAISWTFNKKTLAVSYGVPSANFLTNRTSTDAWDQSASKFWADMALLRRRLKNNVRAYVAHPTTIDAIIANEANRIFVTQNGTSFNMRRRITDGGNSVLSSDMRENITLIAYDKEGETLDATNQGTTLKLPFMPTGKILAVGNNTDAGYRVGEGATVSPLDANRLGYTHIGPTIEGGGQMGRWARVRTPDGRPWSIEGEAVTNILPVIEAPDKIAVASSDLA